MSSFYSWRNKLAIFALLYNNNLLNKMYIFLLRVFLPKNKNNTNLECFRGDERVEGGEESEVM